MRNALLAGAAAFALCAAAPAEARLMISADINGTTITCADQAACDTNPAVGTLTIADQTIAGVEFLGSAQTQTIGPPLNALNTTSFQIVNTNASAIAFQVAVSGTNFTGPVTTTSESGSGTFQSAIGSTIDLAFFADNANTQGAATPTDLPGTKLADSGTIMAALATDSFNFNTATAFADPDLFSMALGTSGMLTSGGSLVGRSQAIVAEIVPIPEPAGLWVFGLGVLAVIVWHSRHRIAAIL